MMKTIQSLIHFGCSNLIAILIWMWMVFLTAILINTREKIDKMEKSQEIIMELIKKKSLNDFKKASTEFDTNDNKPYGNSDGFISL